MQKPLPPQNSTWSRTRKTKILAWKNHSCEPVSVSKTFVQSMHLSHTKISLYVTIWHNYPNGGTEDQKHPPLLAPPQSSSSSSCLKPTPIFFYTFCSACMGCFSFSFFFFICCVFLPSFTFSAPISTHSISPDFTASNFQFLDTSGAFLRSQNGIFKATIDARPFSSK